MKKIEVEKIKIATYNYSLPDEKIAKYPLPKRDASKLLVYGNDKISTYNFCDIAGRMPRGSLLIFNNTRVIHARLIFNKRSGAVIEVFCLLPHLPGDYSLNFQQRSICSWHCMIGNAKRWKDEVLQMQVSINGEEAQLSAKKIGKTQNDVIVEFSWDNANFTFSELLEVAGKLPIPPYLNRVSEAGDDETYQTVYSEVEGSVAAPTAGLHFTQDVMESFRQQEIESVHATLHVGAGTFKPVKSEIIGNHDMHTEFISVSSETIRALYENKNNLIVVGTTSMRTVESLYYIGKKILLNPEIDTADLGVSQWEPYDEETPVPPKSALRAVLDYLDRKNLKQLFSCTQIIIVPGYLFHYPQAIITNFHQPQSTLLLLIAAFVGEDWRKIYDYALQNNFRFLSYGDGSLLWKKAAGG